MITQKEILMIYQLNDKLQDELEKYLKSIGIMTDKHRIDKFEVQKDMILVTYYDAYSYSPDLHEYEVPFHIFPA